MAVKKATTFTSRHGNVALYIPNLIGYARILCALMAFGMSSTSVYMTLVLYFLSFACDELDGRVARLLGQQSTMGAVLDMVTDRVATCGLVTVLYGKTMEESVLRELSEYISRLVGVDIEKPTYVRIVVTVVLIGLMFLDVMSHWFHMYASVATQGLGSSHKTTNTNDPWLIQMYYKHRIFMGYCCVCVEVEYLMLYAMTCHEVMGPWSRVASAVALLCGPGFLLKQVANAIQLRHACTRLIELDQQQQVTKTSPRRSRSRQRKTTR